MLEPDTQLFLQIPDDRLKRILYPGTILQVTSTHVRGQFDAKDVAVEEGRELFLYFDQNREFMQQGVRVVSAKVDDETLAVDLELVGDPSSAESRQSYRVSCIAAGVTARFGDEEGCEVLDVSATGLSVCARDAYGIGTIVVAMLHHEGEDLQGHVCIQSVKHMSPTETRHGLHCVEDEHSPLQRSLQRMNLSIQRKQLQRRAGTS